MQFGNYPGLLGKIYLLKGDSSEILENEIFFKHYGRSLFKPIEHLHGRLKVQSKWHALFVVED